jgi:acetylornithine deacetylase/succinyl-diaminopimelate desuccinylase-like protein
MKRFSLCYALTATMVFLGALGLPLPAQGQQISVDHEALADQAVERLAAYLRVDTINPPGNETAGVEFLAAIFEAEGVEYETAESALGRGNIWARIPGGEEPGLLLLHHIDVVPADRERWTTDPLGGETRDGYLYGRGALDTKGLGIVHLQAFLALHQSGLRPNRDVIFMATADEEAGGFFGAGWLVDNRPELFHDIGIVLNEGGDGSREGEGVAFTVEVTQKVPLWLRLVSVNTPGHGSMPQVESSVTRLLRALSRIQDYEFPARIVPAVNEYFRAQAETHPSPWREAFADLPAAVQDRGFLRSLQLYNPFLHALTRNTCSITVLEGSNKINVVPPVAAAELDCRLLPDQNPGEFRAELAAIINDDTISVDKIMGFSPAVSDSDTDIFRAIHALSQRHYPGARVIPGVSSGFTDSHFFRDLGILAYGWSPMVLDPAEQARFHGNDERIEIEQLRRGTMMLIELLETLVLQ